MPISNYADTAAGNNTGGSLFPEGMTVSSVNDSARQMQADVRNWYVDAEWLNLGYTTIYASGTSFTVVGLDVTGQYSVGRRVRAVGSTTGTIYGKISASTFSTNTTVTVVWDSGNLEDETLTISVGIIKGTDSSSSLDIASLKNSGTMALQDADGVAITGGEIKGITDLAIADGGTGASDAATAFSNLKQAATDAASGVVELATAAEVLTGTDILRAITAAAFAGNKSLAVPGYYKLPGGFMVQWGTGAGGSGTISYPVQYPNQAVFTLPVTSNQPNPATPTVNISNPAQFTWEFYSGGPQFFWVSFGF